MTTRVARTGLGNVVRLCGAGCIAVLCAFLMLRQSPRVLAEIGESALQFNGTNQYVTFGTAAGLGTSTFTLEVWFKWTGGGTTGSTGSGGTAPGFSAVIPLLSKGGAQAET